MAYDVKPAWELEQEAHTVNATDWQPMPGMVKKRCLQCSYLFAVKAELAETTATCPSCRPRRREHAPTTRASPGSAPT
jgi:hypothetical protein